MSLLAEEILQATQEPYRTVMERLAQRELALPFAADHPGGHSAPVPRRARWRTPSPKEESLLRRRTPRCRAWASTWRRCPTCTVDAKDIPRKNPRPLTLAIEVPGDVRLSAKPGSGVLHQGAGDARVGARAALRPSRKEQRFELARLGNPTVGEAYSALFEDLLEDPVWLEEHAGVRGRAARAVPGGLQRAQAVPHPPRGRDGCCTSWSCTAREGVDAKELYRAIMERTGRHAA